MGKIFISRRWQWPKFILGLFVAEVPFTVAALALFGIASPDLYRTKMWQIGSDNGFNSNPNEILYSYANYRPMSAPLPWSQFITNFNIVISVLSMFLLIVKVSMFIMHVWFPLLSLLVHAILVALYAVSVQAQQAPDYSDPEHPSVHPWYLSSQSCKIAPNPTDVGYCKQAVSAFAVTVCLLALFAFHFLVSVYSMIPTKDQRLARETDIEETKGTPASEISAQQQWELSQIRTPATAGFAHTPRTKAFNALAGGGLPSGYATPQVQEARQVSVRSVGRPSQVGVTNDLPLREGSSQQESNMYGNEYR